MSPESFDQLGKAARNLLEYGFNAKSNPQFVAFCIPLVVGTYATDPDASRVLLKRVFGKEDLQKFAYVEVPALTRQIAAITKLDPEFAVLIYEKTFAHHVDSQKQKQLSATQIMPMSSSESDMYGTAGYGLAAHISQFYEDSPAAATEGVVRVIEGHIATRHPIAETIEEKNFAIAGITGRIIEDGSRYWSFEFNYGNTDTGMILLQHMENLRNANEDQAKLILSVLLSTNRAALLWAKLLRAGAERPELYGALLWELATHENILTTTSTMQDAIDAIKAFYPSRTEDERRAFEEKVFAYGEDEPSYKAFRKQNLDILFQTIGRDLLVTEKAQLLSVPEPGELAAVNGPAFEITGGVMPYELRERLEDDGVNLQTPVNSKLMALIEEIGGKTQFDKLPHPTVEDIPGAVSQLRRLSEGIADAEKDGAAGSILRAARNLLSSGNTTILESAQKNQAVLSQADLSTALETALSLLKTADEQSRESAVLQLYLLCRYPAATKAALQELEALAADPNPTIRRLVVLNLNVFFDHAPAKMWKLAESFTNQEQDAAVLAQLVARPFSIFRNLDPKRIESMVLRIRDRFPYKTKAKEAKRDVKESLWEQTAKIMADLYVWNARKPSRDQLFAWAVNPEVYVDQIRTAVYEVREAVCQGYDVDSPEFKAARERIHALLAKMVDHSAAALEKLYALKPEERKAKVAEEEAHVKNLEYACASFFFGSGTHQESGMPHASPIMTDGGKGRCAKDAERMFKRIGDVAIPHTVYELVRVLNFLLSGNPALCFDLFSHALATSGRKHGFQGEFLGVDILVTVVSRCLADHDYIFDDKVRRDKLVAILDIFIEAGWPNALRLLYRLPDVLR